LLRIIEIQAEYQILYFVKAFRIRVEVYSLNGGYKEQDRKPKALKACLLSRELFLVGDKVVAMQLPFLPPRHRYQFGWLT